VSAKVDLAIPKGAAAARQGKSKYRHAVRQTAEQREEKDEVEEELKRRGTRMTT
jgi:ribosomal protein L12E/L44/L45/RPP1/RPP2